VRQNQQGSLLLRLPVELRHLIFRYALGGKTYKIEYGPQRGRSTNTTKSEHGLALLAVCRQVFIETSLLPFRSNRVWSFHPMVLNIWIGRLLSAFAEVVTSVRLHICIRSFSSGLWYDMYNDRPLSLDITLRINNKRLSSIFTSLQCVQLVITARQMIGRKFST
jgi:hypothetical protein